MRAYLYLLIFSCILAGCQKSSITEGRKNDSLVNKPVAGWHAIAPFPGVRQYGTGFSLNGFGYVCGGVIDFRSITNDDMYMYDPGKDTWIKKAGLPALAPAPPPQGRYSPFSFVINNIAYAGGGNSINGIPGTDVEQYDPVNDKWTLIAQCPANFYFDASVATSYQNQAIIFSYWDSKDGVIWKFNPSSKTLRAYAYSDILSFYDLNSWFGTNNTQLLYGNAGSFAGFLSIDISTFLETSYGPDYYYPELPTETNIVTKNGTFYKNCMYVSYGDAGHLYRYNFTLQIWQHLTSANLGIVDGVSTFLIGSKLYIIGGNSGGVTSPGTSKAWAIDLDAYP